MAASSPFIVVSGNIAAGKSTLVRRLSPALGLPAYPERVEENPFFGPPSERSLPAETWFLADAAATHRAIQDGGQGGLQERSVYEHVPVFAQARAGMGWLGHDELALLQRLAALLSEDLDAPDLLVYVEARVDVLRARIAARGRPGEQALDAAYLAALGQRYEELVAGWRRSPVLRLDGGRVDVRDERSFAGVLQEIEEVLSSTRMR